MGELEKLIRQALKAMGLPEGLHTFINVEKQEDIAPKIAELKKLFPTPYTKPTTIDEILADEDLSTLVSTYKDKEVLNGIKTFVRNKGGNVDKLSLEIKDGEIVDNPKKVDKPGEPDLGENPIIKGILEAVQNLTTVVSGQAEEKKKEVVSGKLKLALKEANLPDSFADNITLPENATDDQIKTAVEGFQQKLNDANLSTLGEPGQGQIDKGAGKLEQSMNDWGESKKVQVNTN